MHGQPRAVHAPAQAGHDRSPADEGAGAGGAPLQDEGAREVAARDPGARNGRAQAAGVRRPAQIHAGGDGAPPARAARSAGDDPPAGGAAEAAAEGQGGAGGVAEGAPLDDEAAGRGQGDGNGRKDEIGGRNPSQTGRGPTYRRGGSAQGRRNATSSGEFSLQLFQFLIDLDEILRISRLILGEQSSFCRFFVIDSIEKLLIN